jgi:hypothetical protein
LWHIISVGLGDLERRIVDECEIKLLHPAAISTGSGTGQLFTHLSRTAGSTKFSASSICRSMLDHRQLCTDASVTD